ncbi:MAG TPA: MlaD family protein [Longimicrobiales bacterium]|jgi:phospholipid/cholesterol/gamma-HCH transport system substrate-binding protein
MDNTKRNVAALGALTVLAVVLFVFGLYYLLGSPLLKGGMDVVVMLESGGGLKRGDRVTLQGVNVGAVRGVQLNGPQGVTATLRLNDDLPLPADTRANIVGDVFGAHTVELLPGTAMVKLEKGDTLRGMNEPALAEAATELSATARNVLIRADSLLSPQAVADIHATTSILPSSALQLRAAFTELRLAAAALKRTTEAFDQSNSGPALAAAIGRIDSTARAMNAVAVQMERSLAPLQSVFAKVDQGRGTLGMLVNDTSLYTELNGAARELRALATDIKANPKRYVTIEVF